MRSIRCLCSVALLSLSLTAFTTVAIAAPVPPASPLAVAGDDACAPTVPGIIVHDDGGAEDGLGVFETNVSDGRLVDLFTPTSYPAAFSTVCFSFITFGPTTLDFNVVVYAPDGAGGSPGTLLGSVPATATNIRNFNDGINPPMLQGFDISELGLSIASGSVYIGAQWDARSQPDFSIAADQTPTTPSAGGYYWYNVAPWQAMGTPDLYAHYRALFVRAVQATPTTPTPRVDKAFSPALFQIDTSSTLTITLSFPTGTTTATLTEPLTDTLPAGLVIAPAANAGTTCANGSVTGNAGETSVELSGGAEIPAAGSCTVTVDVQANAAGSYHNVIGAGALATDQGSNVNAAHANATVYGAGGVFPPDENFEETTPPDLPGGWTTTASGGDLPWVTQRDVYDSLPTAAHTPDVETSGEVSLITPPIAVMAGAQLSFRQKINAEQDFDGGRLEISIDGGSFTEIISAGGRFLSGGYNGTLSSEEACTPNGQPPNPLGAGPMWTDASTNFFTTTVNLPAASAGHMVQLRWRFGTDCSFANVDQTGWWIDTIHLVTGGASTNPPSASVAPTSIALTATTTTTASATLTISNAALSEPLSYVIVARGAWALAARGESAAVHSARSATGVDLSTRPASTRATQPSLPTQAISGDGTLDFVLDDGSYEDAIGAGNNAAATETAAIYLNRFTAPAGTGAYTIDQVAIQWPAQGDDIGLIEGKTVNIVAYYDADGDGDPSNAVRLGSDQLATISATGAFESYPVSFDVPAAGDVYVGFIDAWALAGDYSPRLFPGAIDLTASQMRSYISTRLAPLDLDNLANDSTALIDDALPGSGGNWLIRATGTTQGSGGPCSGPIVPWLTASPTSGMVTGGESTSVAITANPAAADPPLTPGIYSGAACVTTNDPSQTVIAVAVTLTVSGTPANDMVFCSGFEIGEYGTCGANLEPRR